MKIKKDFILRTVAGQNLVVPVGEEGVNFNGIITLNNSGKLLFEAMKQKVERVDLIKIMLDKYDIDKDTAEKDVDDFIKILSSKNLIEF